MNKLLHYLNLDQDLDDFEIIHATIEKDVVFKGTNLWILVFAIIIASVGLNMNSTAVIIGAMLISPLMGPINGMGYSIATFNFPLFRTAIKNFSFAVIASLLASTAYFAISPVSDAYSELLARTSPTIYDVLIAFFGGSAGIVAITSKHKGNVIPGVAIATALMPPLCTAGYGLATAQFSYFFGAFYLFTINTVFIALSSVAIAQILKFPIRTLINTEQKKRVNQWITTIILVTIIPSIYFGYRLVQNEKFSRNASAFINSINGIEGNYLLDHRVNPGDRSLTLVFLGDDLSEKQVQLIHEKAAFFKIDSTKLEIKQSISLGNRKGSEIENMRLEISKLTDELSQKDKLLNQDATLKQLGNQLFAELNAIYPAVHSCAYNESLLFGNDKSDSKTIGILIIKSEGKNIGQADKGKIRKWIANRFPEKQTEVFFD
jgi:uncharacterized hydrophobic protein (TIGR00271 family)